MLINIYFYILLFFTNSILLLSILNIPVYSLEYPIENKDFKVYENANLKIKMLYPNNWEIIEENNKIIFSPNGNQSTIPKFIFTVDNKPRNIQNSPGPYLEEVNKNYEHINFNFTNFQSMNYDSILRNDYQIHKMVFVAANDELMIKGIGAFLINSNFF